MTSQLDLVRARLAGRRRSRPGAPHVVALVSGRGGSGVSLLSAVLAIESARAGHRTLLVDADPWLDVQRVWLGLPKGPCLDDLTDGAAEAESLVQSVHGRLELISCGGGEIPERDRRALARRLPSTFERRDVVVIDAGCRLEAIDRCIDLQAGSVVVVSGPDAIGLASTHALIKAMLQKSEIRPSVLFNRVGASDVELARSVLTQGTERFLGLTPHVVGGLPIDRGMAAGLVSGAMLPEHLVESPLPDLTSPLMARMTPWMAA